MISELKRPQRCDEHQVHQIWSDPGIIGGHGVVETRICLLSGGCCLRIFRREVVDRHVRILRPDPQGNEAEAELSLARMTLQIAENTRGLCTIGGLLACLYVRKKI